MHAAEARRLLNPAFLGALIAVSAKGYREIAEEGLPLLYGFLVPPFVLHAETRGSLPPTLASRLLPWSERNAEIVAGFGKRTKELAPYSSKGMLASITGGLATLTEQAEFLATDADVINKYAKKSTKEVQTIMKKAEFVGKWLAAAGTPPTIFTALGVRFVS